MIDEDATQPEWIAEVDEIVQATSQLYTTCIVKHELGNYMS